MAAELGLRLANQYQVGPWRQGSEGVYQFDVPGSGSVAYTVRMPLANPMWATCTCFDHMRDRFTCNRIIADLLTASRLDARAVPLPASPIEGSASQPVLGTGMFADALRAFRESEKEAARLRDELESRSEKAEGLRARLRERLGERPAARGFGGVTVGSERDGGPRLGVT